MIEFESQLPVSQQGEERSTRLRDEYICRNQSNESTDAGKKTPLNVDAVSQKIEPQNKEDNHLVPPNHPQFKGPNDPRYFQPAKIAPKPLELKQDGFGFRAVPDRNANIWKDLSLSAFEIYIRNLQSKYPSKGPKK